MDGLAALAAQRKIEIDFGIKYSIKHYFQFIWEMDDGWRWRVVDKARTASFKIGERWRAASDMFFFCCLCVCVCVGVVGFESI